MPISADQARLTSNANESYKPKTGQKKAHVRTAPPTKGVNPVCKKTTRTDRIPKPTRAQEYSSSRLKNNRSAYKSNRQDPKRFYGGLVGSCLVASAAALDPRMTSSAAPWEPVGGAICPRIDDDRQSSPQVTPHPLCADTVDKKMATLKTKRIEGGQVQVVAKKPGKLFLSTPDEVISQKDVPSVLDAVEQDLLGELSGLSRKGTDENAIFYPEDLAKFIKSPRVPAPLKGILRQFLDIMNCSKDPKAVTFQVVFYAAGEDFDVDQPHSHLVKSHPSPVHILSLTDDPSQKHCTRVLKPGSKLKPERQEDGETDQWFRVVGALRAPSQPARKISTFQGDAPHIGPKGPLKGRRAMFIVSEELVEYRTDD